MLIDLDKLNELSKMLGPHVQGKDIPAMLSLAADAQRAERYPEAEKILQSALLIDPDHGPTWALVGSLTEELGEIDTARAAYRRAMSLGKDDASALALARLLSSSAEWSEARALAQYLMREAEAPDVREGAAVLLSQVQARTGGVS